jgi:hypothetical protein
MATGQTHGGKGSATRPTDKKKYEDSIPAVFGREEPCGSEFLQREKKKEVKGNGNQTILNSRMRTPDGTMLEKEIDACLRGA